MKVFLSGLFSATPSSARQQSFHFSPDLANLDHWFTISRLESIDEEEEETLLENAGAPNSKSAWSTCVNVLEDVVLWFKEFLRAIYFPGTIPYNPTSSIIGWLWGCHAHLL